MEMKPVIAARLHLALLGIWALLIPVSVVTGWVESVVFVSAASIYANMATHWSAYQGAHSEQKTEETNGTPT